MKCIALTDLSCRLLTKHSFRYQGSLVFNILAFLLPALYGTLDKLWIANIDPSQVVTTDIYTYIGVIVEVLNDGLPRSAWLIIGDKSNRTLSSRLTISYTLIFVQTILGAIMTVIFVASSERLAAAFVPAQVRDASIKYVQISSISALSSAMQVAVSNCTRALDNPDVPLLIATISVAANIVLDLLIISKFHVGSWTPTIIDQALIRMTCDITSALVGLIYFAFIARRLRRQDGNVTGSHAAGPKILFIRSIKTMASPSTYTFVESALRNALYQWLVSSIISLGENYGTAWGVFNTIRWGLVMVPVQALEASTLAFVGHNWGEWRASMGTSLRKAKASRQDLISESLRGPCNLANVKRNCSPGLRVLSHCSCNRETHLHRPFFARHGGICVLPFGVSGGCVNNGRDVAGKHRLRCVNIELLNVDGFAEHRLVLYLLRIELSALSYPAGYQSPLVPIPNFRIQPAVGSSVGHRSHQGRNAQGARMDILLSHIRRVVGL